MYHILRPYKRSWDEMILKNAFKSSCKIEAIIYDSISKFHQHMFTVYLLNFIIMYIFLFKITILIYIEKYHIDDFIIHLWHLNKVHFVKNLMWHKKWTTLSCNYPTSKATQMKEKSDFDKYPIDQFDPLTIELFGWKHKQAIFLHACTDAT